MSSTSLQPAQSASRIGLLGGSFDPPHLAHLALAHVAQQQLDLDELRWLPAGAPWQKAGREMASAEHRLAMLRLLLADQPGMHIDPRELQRDGATYTVDTLRELRTERPDAQWFLLLGQDQYQRLDTWRDWPELLRGLNLAVVARDGQAPRAPLALAQVAHQMQVLTMARLDISASQIRQRCARGLSVTALVGAAVAGYSEKNGLYAAENRSAAPAHTPDLTGPNRH